MSEVEFEEMLENVRAAMTVIAQDDLQDGSPDSLQDGGAREDLAPEDIAPRCPSSVGIVRTLFPQPANDNDIAWPLLPFPDGWYASC